MDKGRLILASRPFQMVIDRLCHELIENYDDFEGACLIGIQPRGPYLSDRIFKRLTDLVPDHRLLTGKLDIAFYRDDHHLKSTPILASETQLEFPIEGKRVILVDDVLYTGRTIQAAMTALGDHGRPASVELLALVDRRFNRHLPILANYAGLRVDAVEEAYVRVSWQAVDGEDKVMIYPNKLVAHS